MIHRHGFAFADADTFMSAQIKPDGSYQGDHLPLALAHVQDFACAIDGGAHVGTWSVLMAADFRQVIACEPCPDTFTALTENLATHGCANVEARCLALGAKAHEVGLVLDGWDRNRQNLGAVHVCRTRDSQLLAKCEPIDEWALPSLGFLKLDVEGSEMDALLGADATIRRCQPVVLFENKRLWMRYGHRIDAPQHWLRDRGYVQVAAVSCDVIWAPESRA